MYFYIQLITETYQLSIMAPRSQNHCWQNSNSLNRNSNIWHYTNKYVECRQYCMQLYRQVRFCQILFKAGVGGMLCRPFGLPCCVAPCDLVLKDAQEEFWVQTVLGLISNCYWEFYSSMFLLDICQWVYVRYCSSEWSKDGTKCVLFMDRIALYFCQE